MNIIVALTGASGVIYGIRLLEVLHGMDHVTTHLIISDSAEWNILYETDYSVEQITLLADHCYKNEHIWEGPASGSFPVDAMVISPCSMKTLSAISHGYCDNLITRAADVSIKERRQLILCPRETPLSPIHLENMLSLAKLGVSILPPMPAFYQKPKTIADMIDHHMMKIMDQLHLSFDGVKRWGI